MVAGASWQWPIPGSFLLANSYYDVTSSSWTMTWQPNTTTTSSPSPPSIPSMPSGKMAAAWSGWERRRRILQCFNRCWCRGPLFLGVKRSQRTRQRARQRTRKPLRHLPLPAWNLLSSPLPSPLQLANATLHGQEDRASTSFGTSAKFLRVLPPRSLVAAASTRRQLRSADLLSSSSSMALWSRLPHRLLPQ